MLLSWCLSLICLEDAFVCLEDGCLYKTKQKKRLKPPSFFVVALEGLENQNKKLQIEKERKESF